MQGLFEFDLCNRLVCEECRNYKLVGERTNVWKLPVVGPTQGEVEAFRQEVESMQDEELRKCKSCEEPEYPVSY